MKHVYEINENSTFLSAVEALDQSGIGFLAFVDENEKLIGIATDGDLRRAIIKGEQSLDALINKAPLSMPVSNSRAKIIATLTQSHRRHMPLVDPEGKLVRVFSLDDIQFIAKNNPVVIMAGGLGSRLGALTKDVPKPMLKIGPKPILEHIIERFVSHGFYNFYISVNFKT